MGSKLYVLFLMVVTLTLSSYSISYGNDSTPDSVIKKYYQADLEGARLSAEGYKTIKPLIAWEHEPGWDLVFITKNAKISKVEQLRKDETYATVIYDVIGILNGDDLLEIEFTQVVTFILIKTNAQWKIKQPVIFPHVSPLALSKHIEKVLKDNQNKQRETKLRALMKRLPEL